MESPFPLRDKNFAGNNPFFRGSRQSKARTHADHKHIALIFVTTDFPPDRGGLQEYALQIARHWGAERLIAILACSTRPHETRRILHVIGNASVHASATAFRAWHIWTARGRWADCLASAWRVMALKLRHTRSCQLHMQWSSALGSRLMKSWGWPSRYVVLVHGAELCGDMRPLRWRFQKWILEGASGIVAGSEATAKRYRDLGLPSHALRVIPYGRDTHTTRTPIPRHWPFAFNESHPLRLSCLHRLVRRKGTALLLEALGRIPKAHWNLVVAGDGPERLALEKLTQNLGLEKKVVFRGVVDEAEKWTILAESHLLVLPSLPPGPGLPEEDQFEGLGLTLLEAQALGTPVLAAKTGGIPEALWDGHSGWLFHAGDREDLLRHIVRLLENPQDLERTSANAPGWVAARPTWEDCIEALYNLFEPAHPVP